MQLEDKPLPTVDLLQHVSVVIKIKLFEKTKKMNAVLKLLVNIKLH